MIHILDDSRIEKDTKGKTYFATPKYYCINNKSKQHGFAFSHKEDLDNWVKDECIHYNIKKEQLEIGNISDRKDLKVVPTSICGGDIKSTQSK